VAVAVRGGGGGGGGGGWGWRARLYKALRINTRDLMAIDTCMESKSFKFDGDGKEFV